MVAKRKECDFAEHICHSHIKGNDTFQIIVAAHWWRNRDNMPCEKSAKKKKNRPNLKTCQQVATDYP